MLRVVHLGFLLDPQRSPSQMLVDWWPLVDTAEMVARAGAVVTVVQASSREETVTVRGVNYHFLTPQVGRTLSASRQFARLMMELGPDILHVHGLGFPREVLCLARSLPNTPVFLQDHADGVPRIWRRRLHRKGLSRAAGVSFCALRQAEPFARARMIETGTLLFEIPECSSRFTPGEQRFARLATGTFGDPAVLWVGHLNSNKDPLTVLSGISDALRQLPRLELWCCFGQAPLLGEVERRIASDARLRGRVHLLGKVPHDRIEQLMRAADIFVLGSHRESTGFSVIEALACGLPPVVTAIPSYTVLTAHGQVGALWNCDDSPALCEAILSIERRPRHEARAAAKQQFDQELSFDAVGRKFLAAYERVIRSI